MLASNVHARLRLCIIRLSTKTRGNDFFQFRRGTKSSLAHAMDDLKRTLAYFSLPTNFNQPSSLPCCRLQRIIECKRPSEGNDCAGERRTLRTVGLSKMGKSECWKVSLSHTLQANADTDYRLTCPVPCRRTAAIKIPSQEPYMLQEI